MYMKFLVIEICNDVLSWYVLKMAMNWLQTKCARGKMLHTKSSPALDFRSAMPRGYTVHVPCNRLSVQSVLSLSRWRYEERVFCLAELNEETSVACLPLSVAFQSLPTELGDKI